MVGSIIILAFSFTTLLISIRISNQQKQMAFELAEEMAYRNGSQVNKELESAADVVRTLAYTFNQVKELDGVDRDFIMENLKEFLIKNPGFNGIWTCWEPNAFDGRDKDYINYAGHDETGRFTPYWFRGEKGITLRSLEYYSQPGLGDYYLFPKENKSEMITNPLHYTIDGEEIFITSIVFPIIENGEFLGVVGVDVPLSTLQEMTRSIKPYETGYAGLVANNGIYVAHVKDEFLGQDIGINEEMNEVKKAIKLGEKYSIITKSDLNNEEVYQIFIPITIANTKTPWSFGVSVPMEKVLAETKNARNDIITIGMVSLIIILLVLVWVINSITSPIMQISRMLKELATGNAEFDEHLEVSSRDEIWEINQSFEQLLTSYKSTTGLCIALAEGDLSSKVTVKGEKDLLGQSIVRMVESMKSVVYQTNIISKGNYQIEVVPRSEKDELTLSLQAMARNLYNADERNKLEAWLKTGQTELNNLMRREENIVEMARGIIEYLAEFMDSQVGALYLSDEKDTMKLIASYAYAKGKHLASEFCLGEGLIGQAALKKQIILVNQVPEDYITIQSGLGEAVPRNILVLPCVYNDKVLCVIELGSFYDFTDNKVEFMNLVNENIAISFQAHIAQTRTEELLEESLQQGMELQAQQEELRVINEELEEQTRVLGDSQIKLQVQQEELRVANEELEERSKSLELQKIDMEEKNSKLIQAQKEIEEKAQELENISKYKSQFLANMSHELRTPLNSILILSQLLAENKNNNLTEKQVEFVRTINSSGVDLLTLINDVLDIAKVEAGKVEVVMEEVNIREFAADMKSNFMHMAQDKGLSLNIDIAEDLPEYTYTDLQKVNQIIKNLMSNAIKFTHEGEVSLSIAKHTDTSMFAFSISDTGIGIPLDRQESIFEAFQQVDGTTSRKYGGTGLGLSISREFANLLGGKIEMTSNMNKGSTFTFYLPQNREHGNELTERKEVEQEQMTSEKMREKEVNEGLKEVCASNFADNDSVKIKKEDKVVLIIEDDDNFAMILKNIAQEKGFKCIIAETGECGLSYAYDYQPDGIILDIGLPGMDGWEVMERLKENNQTRHIPIHVISASNVSGEALKLGAIGYDTKPVSIENIDKVFKKLEEVVLQKIKQVLIVADDNIQRQSIVELIARADVKVLDVSNGQDAYELLKEEHFDCIILDLGLEDSGTFDLLAQIEQEPPLSQIPVIIYTDKELSKMEEEKLLKYTESIIIKGIRSSERLLEETMLFLHHVNANSVGEKQKTINNVIDNKTVISGKKILVVDDDMRNVFALSSILEEHGVEVLVGRNGKEGLEKLDQHPDTDLVIMDIMMPEMDGYEAMKEIRKQNRFEKLPIIAFTAKAMKEDREKCIEAGANDYLSKPVDTDKLLSLLRVWLY